MNIALTAGFDKSLPALLMAEGLRAAGHDIIGVVVVSPFTVSRLRQMVASKGLSGLQKAAGKMLRGVERSASQKPNPLESMATEQALDTRSLKAWCATHGVPYHSVKSVNGPDAVSAVAGADALIYGGGGILRRALIDAVDGRVINPHCGPLPEIRGMNAIEWATLLGAEQAITVHFIDQGIDTGGILRRVPVATESDFTVADLRSAAVATGVSAVLDLLPADADINTIRVSENPGRDAGRQCYTLSPAVLELLESRLGQAA